MTTVEAASPSSPPTSPNGLIGKRVSFGNDAVRTFVYEKESEEATPIFSRQPFTDPDAPRSLVTVTTDEVRPESPSPIAPPSQIEEIRSRAVSPPLPSKKMAEHENPFRPEEVLYHEVDPIVEQYLHKPFPGSHPGSAQTTPVKQAQPIVHNESSPPEQNGPAYYHNGLSKEQLIQSEKSPEKFSDSKSAPVNDGQPAEELPPAHKVELVHVKRKKCGCCSVQ